MASLGDTNKDGFDDIAVGAPYDGPRSRGAVYILLGSKNGLITEYSQIIYAEDVRDDGLLTFGWSLSGGLDMDENKYNDLLVGAYASDRVVMLRARPVVNVTATLSTNKDSINLEDRDCALSDGSRTFCIVVKVCLGFEGVGVDNRLGKFETNLCILHQQLTKVSIDQNRVSLPYRFGRKLFFAETFLLAQRTRK